MTQVTVRTTERLRCEITARGHRVVADEPREAGGTDAGPTPYELLLGELGACTVQTLRLYADRQGWQLADVVVELEHERVHFDDCQRCAEEERRLDQIRRRIRLSGALSDAQVARLKEVAARCPVHRTLTGWVEIDDVVELDAR